MNRAFSLERGGSCSVGSSPANRDICLVEMPNRFTAFTPDEVMRLQDALAGFMADLVGRQPPQRSDYEELEPW